MTKKGSSCQFAEFQTVLGPCTIFWNEKGVSRLTIAKSRKRKVPQEIEVIISRIQKHLTGELDDFRDIKLDLSDLSMFQKKVYAALRKVSAGTVVSYGELAVRVGSKGAARAVGTAMAQNPLPLIIPCHRVICADGKLGAYSGGKGPETKQALLKIEKYLS